MLRKFPDHGDTQAMKALILNSQGKTDEAFELAKLALRNAMKSHICWHVYGLLWRSAKNYEEAIKAYKFALRLEPESLQIQRDLAMLQIQMRDYEGYTQSRKTMLQARPGLRQNWTALAIAHHLEGDLDAAETLLTTYEETLKVKPSKADTEHAGAVIYKNSIIAELGDIEQALQHLKSIYTTHPDRAELMLRKGRYLLALERNKEAETVYRNLIRRNPDRREYYHDLEKAMGLDRNDKTHHQSLLDLYNTFIQASSRPDTPQRIPLDFLIGDHFRQSSDRYLRRMLNKGVPSTFATIKALYNDTERLHTIQDLVEGYVVDGKTDGSADATDTSDSWQLAVHYFLAQHYNYHVSRNLTKAFEHIEKAMALNKDKTEYSYVMTKARIWKHSGNTARASQIMNDARELDLKDRYIATKCAKYQLRNTEPEKALKTMGLFTRDKAAGGPLGDLVDMQDVMYLYEDAMAYHRLGKDNLALKRLHTNIDVFETIHEDQFDFHNFSLRKGQIDVYVDLVRWEDHLRDHPWYATSALAAIKIYLSLHDKMASASSAPTNGSAEDSAERKRAAKKARKEAEKARDEAKAAAAAKATVGPDGDVVKPDEDPHGFKLLDTKDPIGEAIKLLQPLLSLAPQYIEASLAGFEVMSRASKLPSMIPRVCKLMHFRQISCCAQVLTHSLGH